jgi:hypothetical protein
VWQPAEVREVLAEEFPGTEIPLKGASELDPFPSGQPFSFEAQRPAIAARGLAEAENELGALVRAGNRVVVAFPHRGEAARTQNMLRRVQVRALEEAEDLPAEPELLFAVAPARRGFVWRELGLVLLPDTQVFRKRPPRTDKRLGRALQSFADLRTGDHVVHEDHGVGKLLGFETRTVAGVTRDYLFLGFRGDDRLYVPHEQLGKVSRYIGVDAKSPALSKLGGKAWQLLKSRARASVQELAGDLIALYAQRQQASGVAYEVDGEWMERLEASFPYRETEDQGRAIEAVKEDLEAPRPMDRLVCGDVGFGKTEVAVRAAFAVATNGKQVLLLAPTTLLAEQHWNTFRERYRDFPVVVEMVSRFRTPKDTKRILADFSAGKVDVLIGTHRILSRDVIPKELGLVILDEEQRFGVAQKELLRSLRLEVDVLTLSATPIPRTLHMSLSGLRDISIIETPPEGRRPIRTTVGEYDEEAIKLALEREVERFRVIAGVVGEAGGGRVRERSADQVAAPQLGRIHRELRGQHVHRPLDHRDRLGTAGATIRGHHRGVRVSASPMPTNPRNGVDARSQQGGEDELRRSQARVRTGIGDDLSLEADKLAVEGGAERNVLHVAAPVGHRDHVLGAVFKPPHGSIQLFRDRGDHALLGVGHQLGAEASAHVARDHAHLGLGQAE